MRGSASPPVHPSATANADGTPGFRLNTICPAWLRPATTSTQQMHTKPFFILLALLYLAFTPRSFAAETPKSNEQRVRDYVSAFNKQDLDTMLGMVSGDIQWLSVAGDKITVETEGKARLRESLAAYFKSMPTVKSELEWVQVTASRVAALERASWKSKSGTKSQATLSVYEFRAGLITRVYYYPAEK